MLAACKHPHVIGFEEDLWDPRHDFLVMEFAACGSLEDLVGRDGLDDADVARVGRDLCAAVDHVHSCRIVHGDIKPGNVVVSSGSPLLVKIADFGCAQRLDKGSFLKGRMGTRRFMAPEVVFDARYDAKIDLWSLGMTIYFWYEGTALHERA
ncbi:kinase-like protein [Auricularia subglabra TFB-10046 SS5]|nr:kinase-like protein [Auricularia subglabra TFB-10046 SS5]